jgi:hypothetical protein
LSSIYSIKNTPNGFYTYAWLRTNGQVYYIGKGSGKRAWAKTKNHYPPKNNNNIVILESNLTETGAFALERRYIRWYGREDLQTGVLVNKTNGGEGGDTWSKGPNREEVLRKMSLALKGKTRTAETCRRISMAKTGINPAATHLRKSYSGSGNPKSKQCLTPNGKIYLCVKDAAVDYGINTKTAQYRCRQNTMGWSYI